MGRRCSSFNTPHPARKAVLKTRITTNLVAWNPRLNSTRTVHGLSAEKKAPTGASRIRQSRPYWGAKAALLFDDSRTTGWRPAPTWPVAGRAPDKTAHCRRPCYGNGDRDGALSSWKRNRQGEPVRHDHSLARGGRSGPAQRGRIQGPALVERGKNSFAPTLDRKKNPANAALNVGTRASDGVLVSLPHCHARTKLGGPGQRPLVGRIFLNGIRGSPIPAQADCKNMPQN